MAVHAWLKAARWYTTMLGPESRFPCGFQAKQATDKSPLQRFGHIVASVVCHHRHSFLQEVKRSPPEGHVGRVRPSPCCYITILANSVLFFSQLRKDKVLSSALESFLDGFTQVITFVSKVLD